MAAEGEQNSSSSSEMEVDAVVVSDSTSNQRAIELLELKNPNMSLAQSIHRMLVIVNGTLEDPAAVRLSKSLPETVMKMIAGPEVENPSLYRYLKETVLLSSFSKYSFDLLNEEKLTAMEATHRITLEQLEAKVEEAKESAGEMEVLATRFEVARFAAKSLGKEEAIAAYDKLLALPKLSSGKIIDAVMECARVASFHGDTKKNGELVDKVCRSFHHSRFPLLFRPFFAYILFHSIFLRLKAVKLSNEGGDWDRRNRLKVYSALNKILNRDFKGAASLLVDCIATFSCNELCSYIDFIVYAILTNILYLPRTEIKAKIVDGPEILSIIKEIPVVYKLVSSLYVCDYTTFLHTLVEIQPILIADRFLQPHAGYLLRELHVLGYKQFLESYKSVTLDSMAASFGVGTEFLDLQLSRFIAAGRLTAKIDKFGGVVETNRPDLKNAQYRDTIQKGDLLLNRIQKLARVVDL
jgi:26S proteasome regulatory subunit N7